MFTGIIEKIAKVQSVDERDSAVKVVIPTGFSDLVLGESVAIQGVCLTVAELPQGASAGEAAFYVSPETLRVTSFVDLKPGLTVNLERAMPLNGRLSGHWVQGHVDGVGRLLSDVAEGESHKISVSIPDSLEKYCVEKGSITLNGVSLTINRLKKAQNGELSAEIQLIPHTWDHTHFGQSVVGERLNIEVDVLAKYVERLCHPYLKR